MSSYPTYTKTDWIDGTTDVNEANLDHIEQGIKDNNLAVQDIEKRLSASGGAAIAEYVFSDTVAEPPGGGQLRMNNAAQNAATLLWLSDITAPGADIHNALMQIAPGEGIYVQDKDDASKWQAYTVTGAVVDDAAHVEVPVAWEKGGTALSTGQRVLVSIIRAGLAGNEGIQYENVWDAGVQYQAGDVVVYNGVNYLAVNDSIGSPPPSINPETLPISVKTASYTPVAADAGSMLEMAAATALTLTVPADATVNFPVGTQIHFIQAGAGQVTIAGAGGVTVNGRPGLKTAGLWASGTLLKRAANNWVCLGNMVP